MNLAAAFKRIKERDGLTFNLSAVKILLIIRERATDYGCNATVIAQAIGNTNSRTQLKQSIVSLIKHEMIFMEQFGRVKKYRVTITGCNLLSELDQQLSRTKLKKQTKKK